MVMPPGSTTPKDMEGKLPAENENEVELEFVVEAK